MIDPAKVRSRVASGERHATHYLEAGPSDGRPVVLVHGWPEFSLAWRHQLAALGDLGYRAIAPDLRGCGGSTRYRTHAAYAQREIVRDMIDLVDALGIEEAFWVGHDWGAAVAWNVARHHAARCAGVAGLCVPYDTLERGVERLASLVNRAQYPAAAFPMGQFEYVAFYHEQFEAATAAFEAELANTFKVIMRSGDPTQAGAVFPTALVRKQGGWFGPGAPAPDVPLDTAILEPWELAAYVRAYETTGFYGIDAFYMNDADNNAYAREAPSDVLAMPALFFSGRYDYVCDTERSDLTAPMRSLCRDLTIETIDAGHWMQHEKPTEVTAALATWFAARHP